MRLLLILLLALSPFRLLEAQETDPFRDFPSPSPILKFSPLSLADPLGSVQFALEYPIGSRQSLQHEVGYITEIGSGSEKIKNREGIRLRNEYRYYIDADDGIYGCVYLAPEFLYIYYNYSQAGTYGINCSGSGNCDYYQRMYAGMNKQVFAFTPKAGYQLVFRRMVLDLYGGLGYRHVIVKQTHKVSPGEYRDPDFFNVRKTPGSYNLPNLSLGMKIGFLLKKQAPEEFPYYREN